MSKKTTTQAKTTILNFVLLILTLGFAGTSTLAMAKEPAGIIKLVRGKVKILDAKTKKVVADPSGKRGRDTKKGSPFYEGETIQTAASARVKLEFVEGKNTVVLGPGTSLVISRAGDGASKKGTDLELTKGAVRSTVNAKYSAKGDDVFQVKTPNAVAGVRGTVFNVEFNVKTAKTKVVTVEGLVSLMNRREVPTGGQGSGRFNNENRGEVLVAAGSKSEMSAGAEAPTPPQKASQQEIEQADELESAVEDESQEGESEATPTTASNSEQNEELEGEASESDGASGAEGNSENDQETAASESDADSEGEPAGPESADNDSESDQPEQETAAAENDKPEQDSSGAETNNEKPDRETADAGRDSEGDSQAQPRQQPGPVVENDNDEMPTVALAPTPSDSMNEDNSFGGNRGIASVNEPGSPDRVEGPSIDTDGPAVDSPSMMTPGGEEFAFEGPAAAEAGLPFDIVNNRREEQQNSSSSERDRNNRTTGNQTTVRIPIR